MIFQYVTRLDSVSFPSPHSNNKLVLDQHYERGFDPKLLGRFICIGCSSAAAVATRRSSSFGVCRTAIMRWRPLGTYLLASAFYLTFYHSIFEVCSRLSKRTVSTAAFATPQVKPNVTPTARAAGMTRCHSHRDKYDEQRGGPFYNHSSFHKVFA
jgi:hypothetical protein